MALDLLLAQKGKPRYADEIATTDNGSKHTRSVPYHAKTNFTFSQVNPKAQDRLQASQDPLEVSHLWNLVPKKEHGVICKLEVRNT